MKPSRNARRQAREEKRMLSLLDSLQQRAEERKRLLEYFDTKYPELADDQTMGLFDGDRK